MSLDNKVVDLADLKVSHDYLLGQDELLSDRINELGYGIDGIQSQITALGNGSPIPVETVAEMTDNTKAYLYTGSEQGYTSGYWYTYDSTQAKFVPRGEYGAGVVIDSTLTVTGNAADAKATGDAIKAGKTFVVQVPGSAAVLSGSITAGDFAKALAAYTAGSGVYAVKDGEVYQLSAVNSSTMTFTQMYHGTMNFIKQIQITSADTFTVTNTALSSSATDTSYSNTASGLTATNVQAAIDENAAAISNTNGRLDELNGTLYLSIDESEFINGKYIWSDGKIYNNSNYTLSPYIRCAFKKIKFNCLTSGGGIQCVAFYSEENEASFIGGYENTTSLSTLPEHEMDVPDGANYIRISKNAMGAYTATVKPWVMSADSAESVAERIDAVKKTADEAMHKADNIDTSDILSDVYRLVYSDTNLIPSDGMLEHSYVDDTGTIKTTTNQSASAYEFVLSGYIPVENGKTLYLSGDDFFYNRYFAWYDVNKNYIGGNSLSGGMAFAAHVASVMVPNNAAYLQITFRTAENAAVAWAGYTGTAPTGEVINATNAEYLDYHYYPENPCDFIGRDICVFNKILCIGDSITAGYINHSGGGQTIAKYSYPAHLQKITGVECINMGDSGETSVSWWETYQNEDFSSYDCAIINLGINDVLFSVSEADTRAAFTSIIGALKSASTGIKIFIANINPAYSRGNTTYDAINAIIEDIATSTENCYFIDLTRYGHTVGVAYANGHLTAVGYWMLAEDYTNAISYIIRNNPVAFRFVQYIGTDLHN